MFGISESYVQAIELGQRTIKPDLAEAIMVCCGVTPASLMKKRGQPQRCLGETPISWSDYIKQWQAQVSVFNDDTVENFVETFVPMMKVLCEAAAHQRKGIQLSLKIARFIDTMTDEFNLRAKVNGLMKERLAEGRPVTWTPYLIEAAIGQGGTSFSFVGSDKLAASIDQPAGAVAKGKKKAKNA
jgi:hypothetical protein